MPLSATVALVPTHPIIPFLRQFKIIAHVNDGHVLLLHHRFHLALAQTQRLPVHPLHHVQALRLIMMT